MRILPTAAIAGALLVAGAGCGQDGTDAGSRDRVPVFCDAGSCGTRGEVRWQIPLSGPYQLSGYQIVSAAVDAGGTPVSLVEDDTSVYLVLADRLIALDAASGRQRWEVTRPNATLGKWVRAGRYLVTRWDQWQPAGPHRWIVVDTATGTTFDLPSDLPEPKFGIRDAGARYIAAYTSRKNEPSLATVVDVETFQIDHYPQSTTNDYPLSPHPDQGPRRPQTVVSSALDGKPDIDTSFPDKNDPHRHELLFRGSRIGPDYARIDEPSAVLVQDSHVVAVVCAFGSQRTSTPTDPIGANMCDRPAVVAINIR
ncbi:MULTISPECIES: hypothetical protein [unclassified Nocardia]|uniref:hypothetical protein n=1 Tax=unclassified Nocardia TaxID=2637762 RepID=UPI00278BD167|nr:MULTISPECIES: hypothetical protein [unclassified Nocardia]